MRVLYLSYDGALDPLGASQVLPYVEGLSDRGHRFTLLTYEKPKRLDVAERVAQTRDRLARRGVEWVPLRYHRRPSALATAYDLRAGLERARRLHGQAPFDLVHVRSYPCATIALALQRSEGIPYLFDMRGFYPEERVDGGLWRPDGPLFSVAKRLERSFLESAAAVITLTRASLAGLHHRLADARSGAPVFVIPTAVDLDRFKPGAEAEPRIVYLGSLGTWYRLDTMVRLAKRWLAADPTVHVEFLVNDDPPIVLQRFEPDELNRVSCRSVPHAAVAERLAGALATFSVIDPLPSKIASAPTKVGESLACGVPILTNRGIGDVDEWVDRSGVGVVLEGFSDEACDRAATAMLTKAREPGIAARCRTFAEQTLSLDMAVGLYQEAYRAISAPTGP